MQKRTIYLAVMPPEEARQRVQAELDRTALIGEEHLPAHEASRRVLARAVTARHSSPIAHCAAMDGYAVDARSTFSAREGEPLHLVEGTTCFAVNTGNPLPEGCDAVIMVEHVVTCNDGIDIEAPVFPWQHVRRIGEDIVATELLFARNHRLHPWDIGALLSGGVWDVDVWQTPLVCIIPTGDEVLDFTQRPDPGKGQVVESNSQMLAASIRELGCRVERKAPVPDQPEALHQALVEALHSPAHVVVFCAGSSAGSKDYTRATLEKEGRILVHGLSIMPGKPSIAALCHGKLVIGAPGYPVSALVCFEELIKPLLCWLARCDIPQTQHIYARLTRTIPSRPGMTERVRLAVGRVGEEYVATPLERGAGNLTSVTRAQASVDIPAACEGLSENQTVRAQLQVDPECLNHNLVCVGSHDNILDVLADELMAQPEAFGFVSAHVGSMGGLQALQNGSCHLSGMHLFDPETNDFNFPFLKRFLPNTPVTVVNLAIRHQGLIVSQGNPLGITSLTDLKRVRFINRQRGAGTRILLDHLLRQANITPTAVHGYEKEESTHMAVAANVLTGSVDCGMGIHAAARALELDFVPLAKERYDLIIPTAFLEHPGIKTVLELILTPAFAKRIQTLGGYETVLTGQYMEQGQGIPL